MTSTTEILLDAFGRVRDAVHEAAEGLTADQLAFRPDREANSVGWLVWHLTRIQDDHVAGAAGTEQVWISEGWLDRFGLPLDPAEHGYGHGPADVDAVRVSSAELLTGYFDAVHARSSQYVARLTDTDLDRVVDDSFDPPVTLGVRLVSVLSDDLQHAGQAAFLRGLIQRRAQGS